MGLGFALFLLWELPAMIIMATHKLICALSGGSLADSFLGVWAYRFVGMFTVWPAVFALIALISLGGPAAKIGTTVAAWGTIATLSLLLWGRFSKAGA